MKGIGIFKNLPTTHGSGFNIKLKYNLAYLNSSEAIISL